MRKQILHKLIEISIFVTDLLKGITKVPVEMVTASSEVLVS